MSEDNKNKNGIAKGLELARRKLLETGIRNGLIHLIRAKQRSISLNIINESAAEIYSIPRTQSKRVRFKAMGKDKTGGEDEMHLAVVEPSLTADPNWFTDSSIKNQIGPDALARRLLHLACNAKAAEEERGLNILYLAIGFLQWKENPLCNSDRKKSTLFNH